MKKTVLATPLLFIIFGFSITDKKTKEDKFWNWFLIHQEKIYHDIEDQHKSDKIFDEIASQLKKIESDLTFEFSPIRQNKIREFTISAEGETKHFPTVKKLINKAPKLDKWKFNALRQRAIGDHYKVSFGNVKLKCCDIYFRYQDGKYGDIGIELNIRNYDGKVMTQEASFHLIDQLIGEYDHTHGIKWIDWMPLDEQDIEHLEPFKNLRSIIDSKKKKVKTNKKHHDFVL